jgi:hypothetical protein
LGDIVVDENNSATIAFDQNISFVVFGNNPPTGENSFRYYDFFTDGSVCVIRGNTPTSPKTSLTIKLADGSVWFGFVFYGEGSKILYQYNTQEVANQQAAPNQPVSNQTQTSAQPQQSESDPFLVSTSETVNFKIQNTLKVGREIFTIGQKRGDVTVSIVTLRNDTEHTYIALEIANNSGNAYVVDGVLFKFIEGKRRGVRRNEASTEERVNPVSTIGTRTVKAYSTEVLGIAIPLFSVDNSGKLEVTVRERGGTRNAILTVKGSTLNQIKVL